MHNNTSKYKSKSKIASTPQSRAKHKPKAFSCSEMEELSPEEQEYVVKALKEGKKSILRFADYFLPHYKRDKQGKAVPPATIHAEFDEVLRGAVTNWDGTGFYNVLGILPRGCAKSTIGGCFFALWNAVYTDKEYIGIVGASEESVSDHLNNIRSEVKTNPLLHLVGVYPDPDGLDNAQHFDFIAPNYPGAMYKDGIRKIRISAYSASSFPRGKNPNGRRFDLVIIDDLEQSKKGNKTGVENPNYRKEIRTLLKAEIFPSGFNSSDMQIVMLGTIMHEAQSLYTIYKKSLLGVQQPRFKCIKYSMVENYGTPDAYSIWPEKMSLADFDLLMEDAKFDGEEHLVYNEYLSEPMSPETQIFHKKDFKYFVDRAGAFMECDNTGRLVESGVTVNKHNTSILVTADLAFTVEKTSDYTSFAICACDDDENIYILDIVYGKWKPYEIADQAKKIIEEYNPVSFAVEKNSGGVATIAIMENELKNVKNFNGIIPLVNTGISKQDRIISKLQFPYKKGKIFHKMNADYIDVYEKQVVSVTTRGIVSSHDDLVDSVSMVYDVVEDGAAYNNNEEYDDYDEDDYNCTYM